MKAAAGFWGESHGEGHQWEAGSVSALLGLSGEWRQFRQVDITLNSV